MLRFLLTLAVCQAWKHFLSFNEGCSGEFSALKGTDLEGIASGGRLPFQFKYAIQEVLKARVAAEGCNINDQSLYELLFGFNVQNVLRFLDSSDKVLAAATVPPECGPNKFSFNWQSLKKDFPGVELPTSCSAADYAKNGCQVKLKLLDEFYIEVRIEDVCFDPSQNGYGLPTGNVWCSGNLCESFARPCKVNADCSGGATCDAVPDSSLVGSLKPLIEMGLFNNETDNGKCNDFDQRFWSGMINSAAFLAGVSPTLSTSVYDSVSLCGVGNFVKKFIPTDSPTPADTFFCNDRITKLALNRVCDGTPDCPGASGEDETNCDCGVGRRSNGNPTECCAICPRYDGSQPNWFCTSQYCGNTQSTQSHGSGNPFAGACPEPAQGQPVKCPDFLLASNTPKPSVTSKTGLSFVVTENAATQHILGWLGCGGEVQIGSINELAVLNGRLPFHRVATEIETVIKSLEPTCRTGASPQSAFAWARSFFPWSVNLWGGLFFSNQASLGIFGDVNPGAKLDQNIRYYDSADARTFDPLTGQQSYVVNPPFANVANAPSSCDLTSSQNGLCELNAAIGSWFDGSLPSGWNGATNLKLKVSSTCGTSAAPTVFLTCDGPCDSKEKSGCCIMRNAILTQTAGGCPSGYFKEHLDTDITDFLLKTASTARSRDTTMQNFLSLVTNRQIRFGADGAPFSDPLGNDESRSICVFNGSAIGDNIGKWGERVATEDCPVNPNPPNGQKGCPQFKLDGPVKGCTTPAGATTPACMDAPKPQACGAQCPVPTVSLFTSAAPFLNPLCGLFASFIGLALF